MHIAVFGGRNDEEEKSGKAGGLKLYRARETAYLPSSRPPGRIHSRVLK